MYTVWGGEKMKRGWFSSLRLVLMRLCAFVCASCMPGGSDVMFVAPVFGLASGSVFLCTR